MIVCPSCLVQTEVKYLPALFSKTVYFLGMSRLIRSDYRGGTECIAKVFSINFTVLPQFFMHAYTNMVYILIYLTYRYTFLYFFEFKIFYTKNTNKMICFG